MVVDDVTNILIVGVGGQGILLAAGVVAQVLMEQDYDVKEAEIHGMSQRGGSVHSMLRYGNAISSPLILEGEVDYLLAFEELEALRWASYARPDAQIIVNQQRIAPVPVALGVAKYPEDPLARLASDFKNVTILQALKIAKETGDIRAANVAMLGALAKKLPFDKEKWSRTIKERVPGKTLAVNTRAFDLGWEA